MNVTDVNTDDKLLFSGLSDVHRTHKKAVEGVADDHSQVPQPTLLRSQLENLTRSYQDHSIKYKTQCTMG